MAKTVRPRTAMFIRRFFDRTTYAIQYFDSHRGVYWYSPGWLETGTQPGKEYFDRIMKEYVEKYGADNAEYLVQTHKDWLKEYQWAAYIDWGFANADAEKAYTKRCADVLGWKYDELNGDPTLMQRLLDGDCFFIPGGRRCVSGPHRGWTS